MSYLTACLSPLPAVNRGTRRFGILIGAPVRGLRAVRALRFEILKVPKPTNDTGSPFFSDLVMLSISESIAAAAAALVMPVSLAILATTSCLFTNPPHRAPHAMCAQGHASAKTLSVIRDGGKSVK